MQLTNIMRFSNAQSNLYGVYLHVTIYKTYNLIICFKIKNPPPVE
jgi:hypothetical protein